PPTAGGFTLPSPTGGRLVPTGGDDRTSQGYHPTNTSWSPSAPMVFVQSDQTAPLLSDGTVLIAGGGASPAIRKAEIYDPAANTWTPTGSMNKQRAFHAAVLLESGEVLVAGAFAPPDKTSELYDPTTGTWTLTA